MSQKKTLVILSCICAFLAGLVLAKDKNSEHLILESPLTYKEELGVSRGYDLDGILGEEIPLMGGKREGVVKRYFSDGKTIYSETPYKDGKKEGVMKEYRPNGTLFRKSIYKNDRVEESFIYYENGHLQQETVYGKNGPKEEKFYYEESGNIKQEVSYGDGGRVMEGKDYREDPRFWARGIVEKGREDYGWTMGCRKKGVYAATWYFYLTDIVSMEVPCTNYEIAGVIKAYYPDGKSVKSETPYHNSKREGEEKNYSRNGTLDSIVTYKYDQRNGLTKQYNADGSLASETIWQDNIPITAKDYKNGRLDKETTYEDGYLKMKRKVYDDKGNLIRHVGFDSIEGVEVNYDKDGNEISRKKWNH